MNGLLEFAVSNAVVAALAAVIVMGVTRVWRNPHLAHLLWALVLVKLITPPLVDVPIPVFAAAPLGNDLQTDDLQSAVTGAQAHATREVAFGHGDQPNAMPAADDSVRSAETRSVGSGQVPTGGGRNIATSITAASRMDFDWPAAVVFVWATGSAIWLGVLVVGVLRFHRLVRAMPAAPDAWQQEIAALAARVKLCAWPSVRLAEGAISPLLWPIGARPVIVLPRALVERLDAAGHRALLAHELAHYYRRDHWVRWFEMLVLAVHWWNPVAWWGRRQLRSAEERCCDAWAIWLLDGQARAYGLTLLETIDFLADARAVSPMAASGMATSGNLKGRFEMILQSTVGRRLAWHTRLAVATIAVVVLPCSLSLVRAVAQPDSVKEKPAATAKPANGWARLSPFTEVRVHEDAADVEFEGKQYELVSIDGLMTKELLDGARKQYGTLWEKRFVEDLVEVMDGMGHRPGTTVKLVLRDAKAGETRTVDRAAMSAENRRQVYLARNPVRLVTTSGGPVWARLSPFNEVHAHGDSADVVFEGQLYQLVSIDALPAKQLLDGARKHYGALWEKRFVEDLVEVMDRLGHRPGNTVKLVLRDASEIKTVYGAPMTAENRQKAYAARYAFTEADDRLVRQLVDSFAKAIEKNDLDALAKTLRPRPTGEARDLNYFSRATKRLAPGSPIDVVQSNIPLPNNRALAVTSFFALKDAVANETSCVVYHLVRQEGGWLVDDIEVKDAQGLVDVLRDAPRNASAEAVD